MPRHTGYLTDRARAEGLGAAKSGAADWWTSRVIAAATLPLSLLFIFPFVGLLGEDHATVLAAFANPFYAVIAILFIGVTFLHLQHGLQEVIEDYIDTNPLRTVLMLANIFVTWAVGLAGVFAVLKIAFTA